MGSFLFKIWGFDPPRVTTYRVILYSLANNFEEILSCFVLNVFYDYFMVIKCPNWEVICIIPILLSFLVKIWVFDPPPGWPYFGFYGSNHKNNTRNGLFSATNSQKWAITRDFVQISWKLWNFQKSKMAAKWFWPIWPWKWVKVKCYMISDSL